MIIKIVCAGNDTFMKVYKHEDNEFLIGCDGGALTIIKEHLDLSLAIGDFDSSDFMKVSNYAKNIIKVSPIKDESDLDLALDYICNLNDVEEIKIYNATGMRLDHYQAVINSIIRYSNLKITIIDENNEISIISSTKIKANSYKYISFFPIYDDTVISLVGFLYPLNNKKLSLYDSLCLSNELKNDFGEVITNKKLLMIRSK